MRPLKIVARKSNSPSRVAALFCLLTLLLAACRSSAPVAPAPDPAAQLPVGGRPPVILRATAERQQVVDGYLIFSQDIYLQDPDGDAVAVTYEVVSSSLAYPLEFPDTPIEASAEEQKVEALYTEATACWQRMELAYEVRVRDAAGLLSEPMLFRMSCTAPVPLDTGPLLIAGLGSTLLLALLLLPGFWVRSRKRPAERPAALRSTLLMFLLFMQVGFAWTALHEGGHSLYLLARGVPVTLYVHPFSFSAFSRPIVPGMGIWKDILGSATALPICLLISLPFWKRRCRALLPLVMLFPYSAMGDGFNVLGIMGDFRNLVQLTGLPAPLFWVLGAVILGIGLLTFFALLPLAGLDPRDNHALFVLPGAMLLARVVSLPVAHLFVPGSPVDRDFFAGREILLSANGLVFVFFAVGLAVLYVTLFRRLYPRLPAWLRSETVDVAWKDLVLPGILWAASVAVGLVVVI